MPLPRNRVNPRRSSRVLAGANELSSCSEQSDKTVELSPHEAKFSLDRAKLWRVTIGAFSNSSVCASPISFFSFLIDSGLSPSSSSVIVLTAEKRKSRFYGTRSVSQLVHQWSSMFPKDRLYQFAASLWVCRLEFTNADNRSPHSREEESSLGCFIYLLASHIVFLRLPEITL